jgi:hypothetical protein
MEGKFHQLAALIAAQRLPEVAAFFNSHGYADEQLKTDAVLPDSTFHDNLEQDADLHHGHSYKLVMDNKGVLRWKDGDCLQRIKGLIADIHDMVCLGNYAMACQFMGILTHYVVDAHTPPHLHSGQPWNKHHAEYEKYMEKFLDKYTDRIPPITFAPYKDIYLSTREQCLDLWPKGKAWVDLLEQGKEIPYDDNLQLCWVIEKAIGDTWLTTLNIIKRVENATQKKVLG